MFWKRLSQLSRALSFRLNLWHGAIFLGSTALLFALLYFLLSAAIDHKDRDVVEARLREYVAIYENGGVPALREWAERVNAARKERMFFVRVTNAKRAVQLQLVPEEWSERDLRLVDQAAVRGSGDWRRLPRDRETDLTVAFTVLEDGTIFQVGRSSDSRTALLGEFRQVFALVIPPVLLLGFIGGALMTRRMIKPVRDIVDAASAIISTGRMDVRVPERAADDELQRMVVLFNRMLHGNEELVRALRDSLDNVAHDLRTPLMRLRTVLETALHEARNPAVEEKMGEALEETERVETIIRTLMDVVRAESGLVKLERHEVDLRDLVSDAVDLYEDIAQEKGITLANKLDASVAAPVDSVRMRQVFANLLDNAIKYTESGGEVSISAQQRNGRVEVIFRDTGIGITEADLPRIWERLYRADQSRTQHGLGLGLNLVKAIVEAHQGTVAVRSELGRGSEFVVSLPLQ